MMYVYRKNKMHTVDQDLFNKFKARSNHCMNNHLSRMDARIVPLVKAFNNIPNLATTWSCSGHTKEEVLNSVVGDDVDLAKQYDVKASRRWYLTFVMTGDNSSFIELLSTLITDISPELNKRIRPKLEMTTLSGHIVKHPEFYKTWSIEGIFREDEESMQMLTEYWDMLAAAITNSDKLQVDPSINE